MLNRTHCHEHLAFLLLPVSYFSSLSIFFNFDWFSGIVRSRSDCSSSVKMLKGSVSIMGTTDFGGPIKGKNQFLGMLFKYGPERQNPFRHLEPLASALDKEKWSLVQLLMSSSYDVLALYIMKNALELDQLINYLIKKENSEDVVLLGHSWLSVSDREYRTTFPEIAATIDLASTMIREGWGSELMLKEADPSAPITSYSSDLSDDQLKQRLGHMSTTPCQVIFSLADEHVPEHMDKKALVARLCRALGGAEKVEIEYGNHSLSSRIGEAIRGHIRVH